MKQKRMEANQGYVLEQVAAVSNGGSHRPEEPERRCRPSLGDNPHRGYLTLRLSQSLAKGSSQGTLMPQHFQHNLPTGQRHLTEAKENLTQRPGPAAPSSREDGSGDGEEGADTGRASPTLCYTPFSQD